MPIVPNVPTWDWARTYRNHHSHEQIKIEIIASLSILLTDKTRLKDLFDKTKFQYDKEPTDPNGQNLFNV